MSLFDRDEIVRSTSCVRVSLEFAAEVTREPFMARPLPEVERSKFQLSWNEYT